MEIINVKNSKSANRWNAEDNIKKHDNYCFPDHNYQRALRKGRVGYLLSNYRMFY